jgi:hypothetical protein
MTSAINTANINENYPVAGIDNNSQGFRDNFNYIKTGLSTAASEITILQANSASKIADNDFAGHGISNAVYNKLYGAVYEIGSFPAVSANSQDQLTVPVTNGALQSVTLVAQSGGGTTYTITFNGWPASVSGAKRFAQIRLHVSSDFLTTRTLVLATQGGTVVKESGFPSPLTLTTNNKIKVVDVWSYDGGTTVYAKYIGEF